MTAPVRLLLVDDHAIVRAGYRHLLEQHGLTQAIFDSITSSR